MSHSPVLPQFISDSPLEFHITAPLLLPWALPIPLTVGNQTHSILKGTNDRGEGHCTPGCPRHEQNLRGSWPSSPPASLLLPARHVGTCRLRSARRGEDPIVELLSWQAVVVKITPPNTAPRAGCSGMTQGTEEGGTGLELRGQNWREGYWKHNRSQA